MPAHAEVVSSMKPLADLNRKKVYKIIEGIKTICEKPSSFDVILKALFDKYSLAMDFNQYVLVGSTVRSYLSYMLNNQMINAEFHDNILLWVVR